MAEILKKRYFVKERIRMIVAIPAVRKQKI